MDAAKTAEVLATAQGVLMALATLISARFLLLLALAGGFCLAMMAMSRQTPLSVAVLVAYCLLVILPPALLEWSAKRRVE